MNNFYKNYEFYKAIAGKNQISVIAEIKKRSPSHGDFTRHSEADLVKAYETGGASAISVISDKLRFNGSLELLTKIKKMTRLPILRKDFLTSKPNVDQTVQAGASGILLIAHNLQKDQLQELAAYSLVQGLTPLLEIHDEEDLEKIADLLDQEGIIIGINNRDLKTLKIDVYHGLSLLAKIKTQNPIIIESAFSAADELKPYQGKIDGALIGTSLLTSDHPQKKLETFTGANPTI